MVKDSGLRGVVGFLLGAFTGRSNSADARIELDSSILGCAAGRTSFQFFICQILAEFGNEKAPRRGLFGMGCLTDCGAIWTNLFVEESRRRRT